MHKPKPNHPLQGPELNLILYNTHIVKSTAFDHDRFIPVPKSLSKHIKHLQLLIKAAQSQLLYSHQLQILGRSSLRSPLKRKDHTYGKS